MVAPAIAASSEASVSFMIAREMKCRKNQLQTYSALLLEEMSE